MQQFRIKTQMAGDDIAMVVTVTNVYQWLNESRFVYGQRLRVLAVTQVV